MAGPLGGHEEDHQIQDQEVVDGTTPGQEVGDPQVDLGEEVGIEQGRAAGFRFYMPNKPCASCGINLVSPSGSRVIWKSS